ncbi:MAG TPA: AMP-binding protein, partial [Armatimonadota bacterium]|nr:AMP-binding protein [Armatimonadota bacterium]
MTIAAAPTTDTTRPFRRQVGDPTKRPPELTVPEMFRRTVARSPQKSALLHKESGEYRAISYGELAERVRHFALGLIELGVVPGDRIALLSENRPEWAIVDLAALSIGAVNTTLYSTLPAPQVQYIAGDSGARLLIVSNKKQLEKALAVRESLPELACVVVMDP